MGYEYADKYEVEAVTTPAHLRSMLLRSTLYLVGIAVVLGDGLDVLR